MAPFLRLSPYVPEVFSLIAAYYTLFIDSEGPLDGALLRRFEPTATVPTVVQEELERPLVAALAQPYPNPFNSSVQIEYSLAVAAAVRLEIFNVSGQRLRTLVNAQQTPGMYSTHWDAAGRRRRPLYRPSTGRRVEPDAQAPAAQVVLWRDLFVPIDLATLCARREIAISPVPISYKNAFEQIAKNKEILR